MSDIKLENSKSSSDTVEKTIELMKDILSKLETMSVQDSPINEEELSIKLLNEELDKIGSKLGLSDLNDFSSTKLDILKSIHNQQLTRTNALTEYGVIGQVRKTTSAEEELEAVDENTDPEYIENLKKEKLYNEKSDALRYHWRDYWCSEDDPEHPKSQEEFDKEHQAMKKEIDELFSEKKEDNKQDCTCAACTFGEAAPLAVCHKSYI